MTVTNHITRKLLTIQAVRVYIRAGVFAKLPSRLATTLLKGMRQEYGARAESGRFLPSHGYSKHESKFFSRFARPIVRCTVFIAVSTFPFFIGILVPICVHVV